MSTTSATNTREIQRQQTRKLILDAATNRFAQLGFEAASLADIAACAGVKKALVQYHFETKEQLWQQAITALWQERDVALADFIREGGRYDTQQQLHTGFTSLARFSRSRPQWLAIMFHESATPGPRLDWLIEHFLRADYQRGVQFIEHCQTRGVIRDGNALQLLHSIAGMLTYNTLVSPMTLRVTGTDLADPFNIASQVQLLVDMLAPVGTAN